MVLDLYLKPTYMQLIINEASRGHKEGFPENLGSWISVISGCVDSFVWEAEKVGWLIEDSVYKSFGATKEQIE